MGAVRPKPESSEPKQSFLERSFARLKKLTRWRADGTPENFYTPLAHTVLPHLFRLKRGGDQESLLLWCWRLTIGLERAKDEPAPRSTGKQKWADLAEVLHCSTQQVKDDAEDASKRGLIKIDKTTAGHVDIEVLWRDWEKLPDYKAPRPELVKPKPEEPERVLSKYAVSSGQKLPYRPIPEGVKDYRLEAGSASAFSVSEVVRAGKITLRIDLPETKELGHKNRKSTVSEKTESSENSHEQEAKEVSPAIGFTSPLAAALADYGIVSEISCRRIIAECQTWAPECSIEEIAEAVKAIGDGARNSKSAKSVSGIVLSQVPLYFKSAAYRSGVKPGGVARKPAESAISERDKRVYDAIDLFRKDKKNGGK